MKRLFILALGALLALHSYAATPFDVTRYRTLISANTIASHVSGRDVQGPPTGAVRMYYDIRDQTAGGFAGKENAWNGDWSLYVSPASALGRNGPLGYAGPLGTLGPVGPLSSRSFSWAWASWMPGFVSDWISANNVIWNNTSPFSDLGPLGRYGPLTEQQIYTTMVHINQSGDYASSNGSNDFNDFPHHLDPSGIWGVLGPAGPLGALGPLGPLGRNGYGKIVSIDLGTGDYVKSGQIVRTLEPTGTSRSYDLVELYPRANLVRRQMNPARSQFVNDTSFSVDAVDLFCAMGYGSREDHSYYFLSKREQWVSLVLTNANAYSEFDFEVSIRPDGTGAAAFAAATDAGSWFGNPFPAFKVTASSGFQNFAMVRARAGEVFKLTVKPSRTVGVTERCGYMLHVVGSGFGEVKSSSWTVDSNLFAPNRHANGITTFNITGAHQEALMW